MICIIHLNANYIISIPKNIEKLTDLKNIERQISKQAPV